DDVDIATTLMPDQVSAALTKANLRAVPTGVEHGTVTAVSQSQPFEITTLRRDVSTDGRRAVVAFTTDWREDALRRDFRFNTLYADARGEVFDATGEGVADAKAGRVVFVGDAQTRIREDYLRILRLFRFHAWYGRTAPDPTALEACKAFKDGMSLLSAERVAKELLKTLTARDPREALSLMVQIGVMTEVLPEARDLARLNGLVEIELTQFWPPDAELRLASMMPDASIASTTARRLRLSTAQHDRIVAAVQTEPSIELEMAPRAARRAIYAAGAQAFADRVKLAWAGERSTILAPHWLGLLAIGKAWTRPILPVRGEDAAAAGLAKGPLIGQALNAVEAWWIEADFPEDRQSALEKLRSVARDLA
ncbi:MAG TPA: CCA tRNA nucleotidyltransferase, partial [Caulobacteraceae bacterium]|nr:CCA tRNA nucleotidyltransferase [Caulobacteraceae bacterium]